MSEIDHRGWFAGVLRDLSERRALERRLADAQAGEREHLARGLHDGLGGRITGLAMMASALQSQAEKTDSPLSARAAELTHGFRALHEQVRQVSHGLKPVADAPEGLMVALTELAAQVEERHGVTCQFDCDPPVYVNDVVVENELFRIVQEAMTNAVRHGKPTGITIGLRAVNDVLQLAVTDDGAGIEEPDQHDGVGLISMRQRASLLGGELTVGKGPNGGTVVRAVTPWPSGETRLKAE